MRVLDALADAGGALSASDLARQLDLSTSTLSLILATLRDMHYVDRLPDRSYQLGSGVMRLLHGLQARFPLLGVANEERSRLAGLFGCGCAGARGCRQPGGHPDGRRHGGRGHTARRSTAARSLPTGRLRWPGVRQMRLRAGCRAQAQPMHNVRHWHGMRRNVDAMIEQLRGLLARCSVRTPWTPCTASSTNWRVRSGHASTAPRSWRPATAWMSAS
ncbi:MAG: helix-turn-helix domain-containing protein [Gammaproteobacteria bacterium]|nr:helix-turn-helix domain-containing protein [Gammaproteobacteria bacterium]